MIHPLKQDTRMEDVRPKILELVQGLADPMEWKWTHSVSYRDAADNILGRMAELGIIEHRLHVHGGHVWIFEGKIFGRTDGVELPDKGLKPLRK